MYPYKTKQADPLTEADLSTRCTRYGYRANNIRYYWVYGWLIPYDRVFPVWGTLYTSSLSMFWLWWWEIQHRWRKYPDSQSSGPFVHRPPITCEDCDSLYSPPKSVLCYREIALHLCTWLSAMTSRIRNHLDALRTPLYKGIEEFITRSPYSWWWSMVHGEWRIGGNIYGTAIRWPERWSSNSPYSILLPIIDLLKLGNSALLPNQSKSPLQRRFRSPYSL